MYFDVWIAQKITQGAENHIFEVLDFQIFRRRIEAPPPPPSRNVCDFSDMNQSEKSLDPRLVLYLLATKTQYYDHKHI